MPRMPAPGDVLLGRFQVESVLGEGGMGIVFGARELTTQQAVAIKVLSPEASTRPEGIPRFINEARATTKLQSPHVVKIFEAGTLENIGLPFIVMEHLRGTDLGAVIERHGKLPIHDAVDYVIQAAHAVAEAHTHGIVHRDLKPSNLFLASGDNGRPIVKVLDFGISKVARLGPKEQALTATGTFLGSPHYMSPEQLRNAKDVDARADIWSLGIILHELLTSKPPFDGGSFGELFSKILTAEITSMRAARPDVPEALEQIILRCLRRVREERFSNLEELALAIAPFASLDGARVAKCVGRPLTAQLPTSPSRRDSPRNLASTALLDHRSLPRPAVGPPSSQPFVAAAAPAPPRPTPSSGAVPNVPPSGPALPSRALPFYAAGEAPQGGARPCAPAEAPTPRGPSKALVGAGIGVLIFGLVGVVLIIMAVRTRGNTVRDAHPPPSAVTVERK